MMKRAVTFALFTIFTFVIIACFSASAYPDTSNVRVPVILYHNIMDPDHNGSYDPLLNISPGLFESHMQAIKNDGYTTIGFAEYYNWLQNGVPLPPKPIIITFDDGYYSNYQYAYPVLKKLNMKATIFIIADRRGRALSENPHFSWNQAREMLDSGVIDIQSHTYSHRVLSTLSDSEIAYEMSASKKLIESNLGRKCNVVAYPQGAMNDTVIAGARKAGYKLGCKVGDSGTNSLADDPYAIKRITVNGNQTGARLLEVIEENMFL